MVRHDALKPFTFSLVTDSKHPLDVTRIYFCLAINSYKRKGDSKISIVKVEGVGAATFRILSV